MFPKIPDRIFLILTKATIFIFLQAALSCLGTSDSFASQRLRDLHYLLSDKPKIDFLHNSSREEKVVGEPERKTGAYVSVREDLSTASTHKLPSLEGSARSLDYEDPELQRIMLAEHEWEIFRYYKAFIDYDKSDKSSLDVQKAKDALISLVGSKDAKYFSGRDLVTYVDSPPLEAFLSLLASESYLRGITLTTEEKSILPEIYGKDVSEHALDKIPLWLVLKYPNVLKYNHGRYAPRVNGPDIRVTYPELNDLHNILLRITADPNIYFGTVYIDLYATELHRLEILSFAPQLMIDKDSDGNFRVLEAWSLEGLWNRRLYKKFRRSFDPAVIALRKHYNATGSLSCYASEAEIILAEYASSMLPDTEIADSKVFRAILRADGVFDKLRSEITGFSAEEKNELLSRAILAGYDGAAVKEIIAGGADINAAFKGETPLMNAADKPEILKILLACGADVDAQTDFGKTALFYAVQFGSIQCVEILLNAGADINHALNEVSAEEGQDTYIPRLDPIKIIRGFTPLIYARRYANSEIIDLLLKRGAIIPEKLEEGLIEKWISEGKLDL